METRYNLLLAFILCAAVTLQAELPTKKVLTLGMAKNLVTAAEAEAKKRGATVVIAVVDDGGHSYCSNGWTILRLRVWRSRLAKRVLQRYSVGRARYSRIKSR